MTEHDRESSTPALSVILCVRDGAGVIGGQLSALAAQTASTSWELVVVDNGSTDGTAAIVRGFAPSFPVPIRIIDASERPGICFARNMGASAALGALLAFCDCDDEVDQGWVDAAAVALQEHDLAGGALRVLGQSDTVGTEIPGGSYVSASFGGAVIGCNFAVRRSSFFAIGGFDESLPPYGCDDAEFSLRANEAGLSVGRSESMVVRFRPTGSARVLVRKILQSSKAETLVWARHRDRYGHLLRPSRLWWRLVGAAPSALASLARGTSPRSVVRDVVTRYGNLLGYYTLSRDRSARPELVFRAKPVRQL